MTEHATPRPVVLCILDGWGWREETDNNAIAAADTPNWDRLVRDCPMSLLEASEDNVGLPGGQMGNSEVGHMNIGSGRVVMQDLPRIDRAIADGSLKRNPQLTTFIDKLRQSGGTAQLMGLLSPGGVHSHQHHIAALANILMEAGIPVAIHAFLDGRDTPPSSAKEYLQLFREETNAPIATVSGRYYAMDRDKRWERIELACRAMVSGDAPFQPDAESAIAASYAEGQTDEFLKPVVLGDYQGMKDGDGLLMVNFRADRARQILTALLDPDFDGFARDKTISFAATLGMVEYSTELNPLLETLFPPQSLTNILGEIVSKAGRTQLRIAETEKYAHVTFFFNGGNETPFPGEERILVPSPKVATYDLQPEMSAPEVTDKVIEAIESDRLDLIILNYANPDMVGHSGKLDAAVKAVETIDACLGRLDAAVREKGGVLLITADHGNVEMMVDPDAKQPHTAHTLNPVPFVISGAGKAKETIKVKHGKLADIAPTVLQLMGLPQPPDMTGHALMESVNA